MGVVAAVMGVGGWTGYIVVDVLDERGVGRLRKEEEERRADAVWRWGGSC